MSFVEARFLYADSWVLDVNLNAGANTLRFTKGSNYAELDSIEIHK